MTLLSGLTKFEKGDWGELQAMIELRNQGVEVFTEFGGSSKVDIIALLDGIPYRIQVKARQVTNGVVLVPKFQSQTTIGCVRGLPSRRYTYDSSTIDVFAVVPLVSNPLVGFVPIGDLNEATTSFRLPDSGLKDYAGAKYLSDYTDFRKCVATLEGDDCVVLTAP